jgi:hypothetical protein
LPNFFLGEPDLLMELQILPGGTPEHRLERSGLFVGVAHRTTGATTALLGGIVTHGGDPAEIAASFDFYDHRLFDPDWVRVVGPNEVGLTGTLETNLDSLWHQPSL